MPSRGIDVAQSSSWLAFSSSVIRPTRSWARSLAESFVSRYGASCAGAIRAAQNVVSRTQRQNGMSLTLPGPACRPGARLAQSAIRQLAIGRELSLQHRKGQPGKTLQGETRI